MGNLVAKKRVVEGDDRSRGCPSKRPRILPASALAANESNIVTKSNDGATDKGDAPPSAALIPPEVWAMAMNFLDSGSVVSCSAASRKMLHDAAPLVTAVHIEISSHMTAALALRLRGVREVKLYSFLKLKDGGLSVSVDSDSIMRVIPFLSHFPSLEQVFFGGMMSSGETLSHGLSHAGTGYEYVTKVQGLIEMISGSFRFGGGLARHIRVLGLHCPLSRRYTRDIPSHCETCKRACSSFPLDQVVNFENQGSSARQMKYFHPRRDCGLDVCLERSQIERIVELRPGGHALLHSDARFLHLLGQGLLCEIHCGETTLHIVAYNSEQIYELKRVIEYAQLEVKTMDSKILTRAIRRSFSKDESDHLPPMDMSYLASFPELNKDLGLSISREDFTCPVIRNANILPHIAKGIMISNVKHHVQLLCLHLLVCMLNVENPPIDQVVDLGLVPTLVGLLQHEDPQHRALVMSLLLMLAAEFNDAHILWVICGALLKSFRSASQDQHMTMINQTGTFPLLLKLLSHSFHKVQEVALDAIQRTPDESLIKLFVKHNSFPRLDSCVSSRSRIVQEGVCSIMCRLMNGTSEQVSIFVAQGCIQALCSLICCPSLSPYSTLCGLQKLLDLSSASRYDFYHVKISRKERELISGTLAELENECRIMLRGKERDDLIASVKAVQDCLVKDGKQQQKDARLK